MFDREVIPNFPHFAAGYFIPKGTTVISNIGEVMHEEETFPKPYEFDPDRFIDKVTGKFRPNPKVIPFGLGKRRCLGEKLARESVFCFFVALLHRYRIEKADPAAELSEEPIAGLTLSPKYFEVKFIPRD